MGKNKPMGTIDITATPIRIRFAACALVFAGLLTACVHIPDPKISQDVLTPEEHVRLGASYEAQGLRTQALYQYEAAVVRDTACIEGWIALGNDAFTQGRFKEAETFFKKVLIISPHYPSASNNLAMVALALNGNMPEAEALAQDALLRAGALQPYVLDTLANIYLRERRYTDAAATIEKAEAATPPDNFLVLEQLRATHRNITVAAAEFKQ